MTGAYEREEILTLSPGQAHAAVNAIQANGLAPKDIEEVVSFFRERDSYRDRRLSEKSLARRPPVAPLSARTKSAHVVGSPQRRVGR